MNDDFVDVKMPKLRIYSCPSAPLFKRSLGFFVVESKNKVTNASALTELPLLLWGKDPAEVTENAQKWWDAEQLKRRNKHQFKGTIWAITPDGQSERVKLSDWAEFEAKGYTRGRA